MLLEHYLLLTLYLQQVEEEEVLVEVLAAEEDLGFTQFQQALVILHLLHLHKVITVVPQQEAAAEAAEELGQLAVQ